MGLGALTKELAKQAIGDKVQEVVDSLRPGDLSSVADSAAGAPKASAAADAGIGQILIGQLQAMQNSLKEDQELVVLCTTGLETLRVFEMFLPAWKVAVLTGVDSNKVVTRYITPVESLQLTCKPMPATEGAKPVKVRFVTPKA